MELIIKQNIKDLLGDKIRLKLALAGEVVVNKAKTYIAENNIIDTGKLLGSIESKVVDDETVIIGTSTEYASYVELGTYKMAPRPFLRTGMNTSKAEIIEIFKDLL